MANFPLVPASRRFFLARSAAVLVASATLPLLAACGATNGTTAASSATLATSTAATGTASAWSSAGASQQTGSSSSAPVSQAAAGQKAQGSVTWLVPEYPLLDKFANQGIVPDFKKAQPDLAVQVVSPGSTAYGEKLLAMVAGGATPDVFTDWGNVGIFTLRSHRIVTDLSTYFKQAKVDTSYLLPEYLTEYTADGELFAVPWNSNPNFIVYNKDMFQKDNVPLPPTDWNDKSWTTDKALAAA
jgi:ABC-type glycerol-3-phosphate transport system substrate-binding protein